MSTSSSASGRPESWAEVHANDQVMRYRRSGAGRAVLLLRLTDQQESLWPELVAALSACFRLIVPDVPEDASDVTGWVADFLEGIGMPSMGVVADDRLCTTAMALASHDADQVARLVLIARDEARASSLNEALASAEHGARLPVLVLRRDQPAEEAVSLVTRFLGGV